jgi:arylsulfatase A-like enzyme
VRARAVVLLAVALLVALSVAAVGGAAAAAEHRWWASGLRWLPVAAVVERFDPAAGIALGVWAALAGALWFLSRRRGRPIGPAPGRALTAIAATLVVLLVVLRVGWAVRILAPRGPNVVLVSIDTLRADRLGAYGNPAPTSPVIDSRLAGAGVLFEETYSQSPKTTPSHMTMLTSLYPSVHRIDMWEEGIPGRSLDPTVPTLAEVLKNAGYATGAFTGGANVDRSRGFDHGFDVYKHSAQLRRGTRWIRHHQWQRFFVFFHTFDVHDPYLPPDRLIAQFDPDYRGPVLDELRKIRDGGLKGDWWNRHHAFWDSVDGSDPRDVAFVRNMYDAGIRHMEEQTLAPLLDLLDALDLSRDTLVVFTSDHGEAFGEHDVFLHNDLWVGTIHVPLILRFPGRLPAGRRVARPAAVIDVMPTILDLVGVPAPSTLQGRSLVADARGTPADDTPVAIKSEYGDASTDWNYASLRRGPLTFIADGPRELLFDRTTDPGEQHDLIASRPALAAPLRAALADWRGRCRRLAARWNGGGIVSPDTKTVRQLRALGYVR